MPGYPTHLSPSEQREDKLRQIIEVTRAALAYETQTDPADCPCRMCGVLSWMERAEVLG